MFVLKIILIKTPTNKQINTLTLKYDLEKTTQELEENEIKIEAIENDINKTDDLLKSIEDEVYLINKTIL